MSDSEKAALEATIVELRANVADLEKKLSVAKREIDVKEVQLRRANGIIVDLIRERDKIVPDPRYLL